MNSMFLLHIEPDATRKPIKQLFILISTRVQLFSCFLFSSPFPDLGWTKPLPSTQKVSGSLRGRTRDPGEPDTCLVDGKGFVPPKSGKGRASHKQDNMVLDQKSGQLQYAELAAPSASPTSSDFPLVARTHLHNSRLPSTLSGRGLGRASSSWLNSPCNLRLFGEFW